MTTLSDFQRQALADRYGVDQGLTNTDLMQLFWDEFNPSTGDDLRSDSWRSFLQGRGAQGATQARLELDFWVRVLGDIPSELPGVDSLLLETGDALLAENGDTLQFEEAA